MYSLNVGRLPTRLCLLRFLDETFHTLIEPEDPNREPQSRIQIVAAETKKSFVVRRSGCAGSGKLQAWWLRESVVAGEFGPRAGCFMMVAACSSMVLLLP